MTRIIRCCTLVLIVLGCGESVFAQPVPSRDPWSTHIFPAGARRGSRIQLRVGAECLPPFAEFVMTGKGVATQKVLSRQLPSKGESSPRRAPTEVPVTYPKEWQSALVVAKDAPLGPAYWRISCAQGGSASRPFIIGDLPEFIESESNSLPSLAELVKLPVTLNGQISGERDMDYFKFFAKKGQVVVCDVLAQRLGSRLDPVVEITRGDGRALQTQEVRIGSDPVVAFKSPGDGTYRIRIAGLTKYGNPAFVYRVNLTTKPYVHFALPAGGTAGSRSPVKLFILNGSGYRSEEHRFVVSKQPGTFQVRHPDNLSNGITLQSSRLIQRAESKRNDSQKNAMKIAQPMAVYGQFESVKDSDWFAIDVPQGKKWTIECRAFPQASAALPVVHVVSSTGRTGIVKRSVDVIDGVCRLDVAGKMFLKVNDLRNGAQGGPSFLYQLRIGPQPRDFQLTSGRNYTALLQGQSATIAIKVSRTGGFNKPIQLKVDGLPKGVKAENLKVPGNATSHSVRLTATADAPSAGYSIRISGTADDGGKKITKQVLATHMGRNSQGVGVGSPWIDFINLTLKHKPVFRLYCSEAYMYAHRGSIYPYAMEIERLGKFKGNVTVQIGDRQNRDLDGVQMIQTRIVADRADFFLPIYLPETMFINVQSQSQLYCQAYAVFEDKYKRRQSVLVVSEKRNMIRTLPPVVKIKAPRMTFLTSPGTSLDCHLVLERTSNFLGKMKVELRLPKEFIGLIKLERDYGFAAKKTATIAGLQVSPKAKSGMKIPVTLRAVGEMHAGNIAVTETKVLVTIR